MEMVFIPGPVLKKKLAQSLIAAQRGKEALPYLQELNRLDPGDLDLGPPAERRRLDLRDRDQRPVARRLELDDGQLR